VAARAHPPRGGGALRAAHRRARAGGLAHHRQGAGHHHGAGLPRLLPDRARDRRVLPGPRHPEPGSRFGRQLGGVLRAGDHRGGRGAPPDALRALPLPGAQRSAGHRPGHRVGAPGGGDPVRLRAVRTPACRPGGERHLLPAPLRRAGRGPRAGVRHRAGGRLVEEHRAVGEGAGRRRDPGPRGGSRRAHAAAAPPPRHPLRGDGAVRPPRHRCVPGGVGHHARAHGVAVGQGRLRGRRPGEVRSPRAGDAHRAAPRVHRAHRAGRAPRGPPHRPPRTAPGRPRGLRPAVRGGHGGGVPGGVARADGHPAAPAPPLLLRHRGGGGADPPRADPGRVREPVPPPSPRARANHLPAPAAEARAGEDARGAALPGAAHADRHRRGRLLPRPRRTSCARRWGPSAPWSGWRRCGSG